MINKKLLKPINKSGYGEIVGTTTHDTLLNRDKAEQHPISAITGLQTTLDAKQAKLTAGAGIDITGDTISSTGGATDNFVTLDTDQEITGKKTFNTGITIKNQTTNERFEFETTASGTLRVVSSGSFELYLNGVTSFAFYKDYANFLNSRLTNIGDPIENKDATNKEYVDSSLLPKADKTDVVDLSTTQAVRGNKTFMNACYVNNAPTNGKGIANKEYVDTNLALKADKLVVPINASIDTSTTINDRVVKVVYKEYTSTGDSVVASTSAGFGYLNVSILRKKNDGSWGIVYNSPQNEVYVNSSNQIRFNIQTLGSYTNEIKLTIQHN